MRRRVEPFYSVITVAMVLCFSPAIYIIVKLEITNPIIVFAGIVFYFAVIIGVMFYYVRNRKRNGERENQKLQNWIEEIEREE